MNTKQYVGGVRVALLLAALLFACAKPGYKQPSPVAVSPRDCINKAIAMDDSLGKLRNHACETITLAQTIRNYADGLQWIDFTNCPPDFKAAFAKHRQAWLDVIPLVKKHPSLRGEMHDLFAQLEKGADADTFKPLLKAIWDTWGEIETAMKE